MTELEQKAKEARDKEIADAKAAAKLESEAEAKKKYDADMAVKDDEIKKLKEKDINFEKTRQQLEDKDRMIVDLKTKVDGIEKNQIDTPKNRMINALSGSDAELKKKIEEAYSSFSGTAATEAEIEDRVKKAYTIAKGTAPKPQDVSRMTGGGGHNRPAQVNSDGSVNPVVKEWANEFNKHMPEKAHIKDEDLKNPKYKVKPGQSAESDVL